MTVRIGVLGATSYTGVDLIKILARHPQKPQIAFLSSKSNDGERFASVFGEMAGIADGVLLAPEKTTGIAVDVVFSCLPHAVSAELCIPFVKTGARVIDLSADFRLRDTAVYAQWYDHAHPDPALLSQAVYGLPEHYREAVRTARLVANPGCYPTSILIPLLALIKEKGTRVSRIIADAKSGVSGAGRTLKLSSHFVEANETLMPYSLGHSHRHVPEIEQELSAAAGSGMSLTFSPHLVPLTRGMLSTIYLDVNRTAAECEEIARAAYGNEPFVRVRTAGDLPRIRYVAGTNFCDIAFTGGTHGQPVIAVSAIDNLLKGASGQAVQNMNIMLGYDERAGLQ